MSEMQNTPEEKLPEGYEDMMRFLDAETVEEKLMVLDRIEPKVTDFMLDSMAMSLDLTIKEAPIADRIYELRKVLKQKAKYEISRR